MHEKVMLLMVIYVSSFRSRTNDKNKVSMGDFVT